MINRFDISTYPKWVKTAALNLVFAAVYYLLAKLGLTLATINHSVSPVWPATGFAFAIVHLFGRRTLPAVFIGAFAANWLQSGLLLPAVLISLGNTCEAFVGAVVLRVVLARQTQLGHQVGTIAYASAAALGSLCSASIGAVTLYGTGAITENHLFSVWMTWWIGDALGGLVVTPILTQLKKFDFGWKESTNSVGVLGIAATVCYIVFFSTGGGAFLFLLLPVLLCALAGVGSFYVLLTSAVVCAVSVAATVNGLGPFTVGTLNDRLVHLQLFLAAYALTGLTLAGIGRARVTKIVTVVLIGSWILAGAIFISFDASEKDITETHVRNLIDDSREKILGLIGSIEGVLRGGVGFFSASKSVEFDEWQEFNQTVNVVKHHVGVNGLGVVWPLKGKEISSFEGEMRAQGQVGFRVRSVPGFAESKLDTRYIVKFVEPVDRNGASVGLDISSEPNRRIAAELSRDTGLPAMTSKIILAQDETKTPSFIVYMPVYKPNSLIDTTERRRAAHIGWVFAPVIYRNFFREIFAQTSDELEMQVFEGETADAAHLVFSNFSAQSANKNPDFQQTIQMGQKTFFVKWATSAKFVSSRTTVLAWVGFSGALVALMLAILVLTIQSIGHRSHEIAGELTRELSTSREKFKQGERRLLYALDGSNDGIWDWHIEQAEMYVSGKIAETHGWPQTFRARSIKDLSDFVHNDDAEAIRESIERVYKGQSPSHEVETRYRTTNGEWRWVLTRGKISERDVNGKPTRMTGVHIDIHELKKAQRLLEETQSDLKLAKLKAVAGEKAAVDATKTKSQFLANMSHEIRTPLNGIVGVTNLLKETNLDEVQLEYSNLISRSSESLLNIINDILDSSKVEAGKLDIEIVDFDLEELILHVTKTLSFVAKGKGLELTTRLDLKSEYFKGDPGRIRQVLTNLIGNSIKFTQSGSVTLKVAEVEGASRSELKFEIIDTGIGISDAAIGRMFQAFSQADATMTRRFGGTGLGLSISKELVSLMDGDIGVESKLGVGSTFWFRLELAHGRKVVKAAPSGSAPTILHGHVLVVEDNKINQLVITANLKRMGVTFDVAENGIEAINFLMGKSFDLILMDCQMPEMDGYEATGKIRQSIDTAIANIPIIALTANALKGDYDQCIAAGMNDYLTKPINVKELSLMLDKWLPSQPDAQEKAKRRS